MRAMSRRMRGAVANMVVIAVAYAIFATSLIFQPARWSRTPAYHNLLVIMPAPAWGGIFAAVALLLVVGAPWWQVRRWVSITGITAACMVTLGWDASFVVRWLTNAATTPETWVSWALFLYVLLRAAALLDSNPAAVEVRPPGPRPGAAGGAGA